VAVRSPLILACWLLPAAGLLPAACATTAPAPTAAPAAGELALANQVYAALDADPLYFYRHVDVRVDRGVADLSGYVWTADAIYRAREIAGAVPGITAVVTSRLELEREGRGNGRAR